MVKIGALFSSMRRKNAGYSRYHREHPHLVRNMVIDAVVSVLTVISIFAFVNHASANARVEMLRKSGAITMTADELAEHVKQEKLTVYWVGPIQGDVYTIICTDPGEILVTYIPSGARLHDSFATAFSVETYSDVTQTASVFGSNAITDPDDSKLVNGANRSLIPSAPTFKMIDIPGADEKVEIHYPTLSSSLDPRMQPDELRLIR
ncbi:MAG: hypothetical protein Q8K86_06555 [Candidatus Nanopelagicaceae bacterium]|nr:hypothetical protein [Candidatus Nanopelagicaceae bacterium]